MASRHPSSFRDPSGFIFKIDGEIFRQINLSYKKDYDTLMASGLFKKLVAEGFLINHVEVPIDQFAKTEDVYKIIKPDPIPFISYPYEWSFGQLKDSALTTLKIQKIALEYGMSLKDASAYNIQFLAGKPIFIDTLSFEVYKKGQPWVAYRQFCQHFLAPLALVSYTDERLPRLLGLFIDGIPLDLATKLLPFKSRFNFNLLLHLHVHANTQKKYSEKTGKITKKPNFTKNSFLGILSSLETAVNKLKWEPKGTEWFNYYEENNNYDSSITKKEALVATLLMKAKSTSVWDFGANTGLFSRLSASKDIPTISFDIDFAAVERNYNLVKQKKEKFLLPLFLDLTNPSPGIGWKNQERDSLVSRGPTDTILALALIHHLVIANNLPLEEVAEFFQSLCQKLIIEFVPKQDSQVKKLLSTREDIFPDYTTQGFENCFAKFFNILNSEKIPGTKRNLYLMTAKKI